MRALIILIALVGILTSTANKCLAQNNKIISNEEVLDTAKANLDFFIEKIDGQYKEFGFNHREDLNNVQLGAPYEVVYLSSEFVTDSLFHDEKSYFTKENQMWAVPLIFDDTIRCSMQVIYANDSLKVTGIGGASFYQLVDKCEKYYSIPEEGKRYLLFPESIYMCEFIVLKEPDNSFSFYPVRKIRGYSVCTNDVSYNHHNSINDFFNTYKTNIYAYSFWSIAEDDISYNKSHVTDMVLFQDSIILVGGIVNDASCSFHNLFAYNLKGQKLWNVQRPCDVITSDANYIYTAGYDIGADDAIGDELLILSKYNKKGNEIFSIEYPEVPYNYFEFKPQNIDVAGDGTVLISFGKLVFKSDINGTKIQEYQLTALPDVKGIFSLNQLSYLIYSQNQIYKSDSSFVLTDSIPLSGSINKVLLENDTVYVLLESDLVRLDDSLNIIDTLMHFSVEASDMEFYNDNLWVQMNEPDSIKLLHVKSSTIAETFSFEKLLQVKGFIATKNSFTFIGDSFTDQIGLYNYQANVLTDTALNLPEIELVDFNIDSISLVYHANLYEDSVLAGFRFNTELTVKNNGPDTIYSFSVFAYLKGNVNCAQNYLYQKFTGLEMLPDQTHTVKLKRAYQEGINNDQLCFECLAPNSKLEIQTGNNSLCKTFTITGIEDRVQTEIKAYPNPFTDYLIVEDSPLKIKTIQIMDINGRILINRVARGQKTTLETGNLEPGSYILKINSAGEVDTRLMIKK